MKLPLTAPTWGFYDCPFGQYQSLSLSRAGWSLPLPVSAAAGGIILTEGKFTAALAVRRERNFANEMRDYPRIIANGRTRMRKQSARRMIFARGRWCRPHLPTMPIETGDGTRTWIFDVDRKYSNTIECDTLHSRRPGGNAHTVTLKQIKMI